MLYPFPFFLAFCPAVILLLFTHSNKGGKKVENIHTQRVPSNEYPESCVRVERVRVRIKGGGICYSMYSICMGYPGAIVG